MGIGGRRAEGFGLGFVWGGWQDKGLSWEEKKRYECSISAEGPNSLSKKKKKQKKTVLCTLVYFISHSQPRPQTQPEWTLLHRNSRQCPLP